MHQRQVDVESVWSATKTPHHLVECATQVSEENEESVNGLGRESCIAPCLHTAQKHHLEGVTSQRLHQLTC